MKKILSLLTVGLVSAGIFFSFDQSSNLNQLNNTTYQTKSDNQNGIYLLSPGEEISQTNDQKYDDYWTQISSDDNVANQLFILKEVTQSQENYVFDVVYSWNNLEWTNTNSQYKLVLTFTNDSDEVILNYNFGELLEPQNNYGTKEIFPEIPVSEIETGENIYINTKLTEENVSNGYVYENNDALVPWGNGQDYVKGFNISGFTILEDSILPNEFQFSVAISPRDGSEFDPLANPLVLYANKIALNTSLVQTDKSSRAAIEYTYKVTDLEQDQVYENWAIGIEGFDNIQSVSYRAIRTAKASPNKPAVISGITIGVIILILLIILIILVALRSRKKVVENNVYNEYRSFLDENGNLVTMTQEEFEKLSRKEAKKYQEVENQELLDGYYEFHSNNEDDNYYI